MNTINLASNIVKGISKKLKNDSQQPTYPPISFFKKKMLKHLDDFSEKKISLAGYDINYIKPYEILHTYEEIFANEIYKFKSSKKNPLIIDCGANIGISILYFKSLFPDARVLAFEPDGTNYKLLVKNVDENHLKNIQLFQKAIWISDAGVVFEEKGSEGSRISDESGEQKGTPVASVRLANLLEKERHVDFLKMDIESAEYEVLLDCQEHLTGVDSMFIEYHGTTYETSKLATLLTIFDKKGFQVYIKNAADLLKNPFSQKKTGGIYDVQLNIFCYKKKTDERS